MSVAPADTLVPVRLTSPAGLKKIADPSLHGDAAVTPAQWGQVAQYAAQGVSAAPGFDFGFFQDLTVWWDGTRNWGNDITTVRVDTRLAAVITAGPDPSKVHVTPWPSPNGNPQPDAFDHRVGDGTWGPEDDFNGGGSLAETENKGTDFAFAGSNPYPAARGLYHYSNLGHIRYSYLAYPGYGLPDEDGTGFAPVYSQTFNDLLWAEGLIRGGGDKAQAAALINKTRVDRGHLSPLTGGESDADLLAALRYEQDIELLGIGGTIYYNHRRIDKLAAMTPRQMPIPAKELGLLASVSEEQARRMHPDLAALGTMLTSGTLASWRAGEEEWSGAMRRAIDTGRQLLEVEAKLQ